MGLVMAKVKFKTSTQIAKELLAKEAENKGVSEGNNLKKKVGK